MGKLLRFHNIGVAQSLQAAKGSLVHGQNVGINAHHHSTVRPVMRSRKARKKGMWSY